jgi:hypothetical protein
MKKKIVAGDSPPLLPEPSGMTNPFALIAQSAVCERRSPPSRDFMNASRTARRSRATKYPPLFVYGVV